MSDYKKIFERLEELEERIERLKVKQTVEIENEIEMPGEDFCDHGVIPCDGTPECEAIVHQLVGVEAQVTIKPLLKHGNPKICCIESEVKPGCESRPKKDFTESLFKRAKKESDTGTCTFTVTQVICVEIPLRFGVEVDVNEGSINCGTPEIGPCAITPCPPDVHHPPDK